MLQGMTVKHLTLITGSSRGLGAALVAQRLLPGHAVLGLSRQQNVALQAQADAAGLALTQWPVDLGDAAPVALNLAQWLARLDASALVSVSLINNAGVVGTLAPLDRVLLADIVQGLRVGLEAAMLLTAAFLDATRHWSAQRRVLNISSGLGRTAMATVRCTALPRPAWTTSAAPWRWSKPARPTRPAWSRWRRA